jgi:uncharacterized Zn finger protein
MARQFGHTWWGRAWIDALEERADLDPNRLPRGRTYARQGHVNRVELEPGRITALVRGSRVLPYRVTIGVRTFDDEEWDRLIGAIASRAGHAAALLDRELDPGVVAEARAARVEILPTAGDLHPRCSCPDHADPCKHAAAVCYLVADAVDADPFALFTLRGRRPDALLAAVRSRRHRRSGAGAPERAPGDAGSDGPATGPGDTPPGDGTAHGSDGGTLVDPGVTARTAWQRWRDREGPPLVELPDPPDRPGDPTPWATDPPADAPFSADGLRLLAADAAVRAWAQLADGAPSGLLLSAGADLARRAARRLDRGLPINDLARAAGETPTALAGRAAVWRHAGPDGFTGLDDGRWRPADAVVDAGYRAFVEAGVDPHHVQVRSNRVTAGDVQLRVTADGRWWRYERRGRTWELVEAPSTDPTDLVGGD